MKFSLHHQASNAPEVLIVPVAKHADSDAVFDSIAAAINVPSDLVKADFSAGAREVQVLYYSENDQNKRLILLGLGKKPGMRDIIDAFRLFVHKRKTNLPASLGISFLHGNAPEDLASWVEAAVNGMVLGLYDIGLYKTEKEPGQSEFHVSILAPEKDADHLTSAMNTGRSFAETQSEIFNLVNAPSNKKTPRTLADWAVSSGKKYGYKVSIYEKKEIESIGLHALLAVNRGSENPPTFIVMEYQPEGKPVKKVGLVGKGVTFDTGGLSIKPSTNMHYMKSDMGGAAAVMGAMEMAAKLELPIHLVGIVPATDNSVDALSIKPGDVINSYNGKTIEVIDTDAEGRLILADGLSYIARNFKPDVLIDLATLTGSCIRTLGTYAGGLFSNNDELARQLLDIGQQTGERLWQLPLWDDYKKEIKSDVADIKNFSGNPTAGAITAAKFLESFTDDHPQWAHMDIAGVAVSDSEFSSQKSATAFGVRLLINYFKRLSEANKS